MEIVGLGDNRNLPDSDCVWLGSASAGQAMTMVIVTFLISPLVPVNNLCGLSARLGWGLSC